MDYVAPLPFRFNPWKHHLQWVCRQLENAGNMRDANQQEALLGYIKTINSNHVDIYTGRYTPDEIVEHVGLELKRLTPVDKHGFTQWLGKASYRLIRLPDNSVWVIRLGNADKRYIHFHPARNSPNAVRIHGNSWKTAIALKLLIPMRSDFSLTDINVIRKNSLNLSPIKDLEGSMRLQGALELLAQR